MAPLLPLFVLLPLCLAAAAAQAPLPPAETLAVPGRGAGAGLACRLQLPAGATAAAWLPVVVLLGPLSGDAAADDRAALAIVRALAERGFAVAQPAAFARLPVASETAPPLVAAPALADLPAQLRARLRIAHGGLHLLGLGEASRAALDLALAAPQEFQSVSWAGRPAEPSAAERVQLRGRRLFAFGSAAVAAVADARPAAAVERLPALDPTTAAAALAAHLERLHVARQLPGAAGEAALALDDFHDAAAKGDGPRYFARLPDDAVFLGTDGDERWTGAAFRAFAAPYFDRGSAWTYVPSARHVEVDAAGGTAWFDEVVDNAAYGACRGTGVLQRRGGAWVVRQYNLTIPVPNDLAKALVAQSRDHALGRPAAPAVVVVVRHAEKDRGDDPGLTAAGQQRAERLARALADLPVAAAFATEFRRTQATLAPLCQAKHLQVEIVPAGATAALAARLRRDGGGRVSVVAAHSNTIPALLGELGAAGPAELGDDEYDRLFVVTRTAGRTDLLALRY